MEQWIILTPITLGKNAVLEYQLGRMFVNHIHENHIEIAIYFYQDGPINREFQFQKAFLDERFAYGGTKGEFDYHMVMSMMVNYYRCSVDYNIVQGGCQEEQICPYGGFKNFAAKKFLTMGVDRISVYRAGRISIGWFLSNLISIGRFNKNLTLGLRPAGGVVTFCQTPCQWRAF